MYYVYLILCKNKSIYTGITTDVKRRFEEHKSGKGGKYTKAFGAIKLLYTEKHTNRSSAQKHEAKIKNWTRQKKLNFIKFGK